MAQLKDMAGEKYGLLTVVEIAGRTPRGAAKWHCQCECGETPIIIGYNLRTGHTRSCGCVRAEIGEWTNIKHGHAARASGKSRTAEYRIWTNMKSRCFNRNLKRYPDYGGRGISVCEEWRDNYEKFYSDMGPRPSKKHSIDRIDVNGNYEPGNCRWATPSQQSQNKRVRGEDHHEPSFQT